MRGGNSEIKPQAREMAAEGKERCEWTGHKVHDVRTPGIHP